MANPVLVEVTRGTRVESMHRGAFVVSDASGHVLDKGGVIDKPTFPRSAVKAMQGLFLAESGAVEHYQMTDKDLALACSSHSGEPAHVQGASKMLSAAGLGEAHLECGCHWSFFNKVMIDQVRSLDKPTAFHNNCSGKHAGFVCAAHHLGLKVEGYSRPDHAVQKDIAGIMQNLTGAELTDDMCGIDGCAIPTYAIELKKIAQGFAKMATGEGLSSSRAKAADRLIKACMAEPFYVAGTDRACTKIMQMAPGRIFAKTGAEGVFCATLPEKGIGIALKIDDGGTRASEVAVAALLAKCFGEDDAAYAPLSAFANRDMHNWNKMKVGTIRASEAFA